MSRAFHGITDFFAFELADRHLQFADTYSGTGTGNSIFLEKTRTAQGHTHARPLLGPCSAPQPALSHGGRRGGARLLIPHPPSSWLRGVGPWGLEGARVLGFPASWQCPSPPQGPRGEVVGGGGIAIYKKTGEGDLWLWLGS